MRTQPGCVQQRIWDGLGQLEALRRQEACFAAGASVSTWDTHNNHVLALVRRIEDEVLVCLFNFSGAHQPISLDALDGTYLDLISGEIGSLPWTLAPYQYCLCRRQPR